jgi:hypothetical protein
MLQLLTAGEFGLDVSGVGIGVASVDVVSYSGFCDPFWKAGTGGGGISSALTSLEGGVNSTTGTCFALPNVFSSSLTCAS